MGSIIRFATTRRTFLLNARVTSKTNKLFQDCRRTLHYVGNPNGANYREEKVPSESDVIRHAIFLFLEQKGFKVPSEEEWDKSKIE